MDPITVTSLTQTGRLSAPDPNQPRVYVSYNADFTTDADVTLDFTIVNQGQTFGIVRSLFIDNGSNPSLVEVSVTGTDDFFTVPAFAQGVFKVNAQMNSLIRFVTDGGATDKVTISVYNWEMAPSVWYKFGAVNKDIPLKMQGAQPAGTDMDAPTEYRNPVYIGGAVDGTNVLAPVSVDATGRLRVIGAAVGGNIFGTDDIGDPPTAAPVFIAGIDSTGDIKAIEFNAAGEIPVHDEDVKSELEDVNLALDDLIESSAKAAVGTITSVVSAAADTVILALNVQRQGATIFNDSTAILYLALANTVATNANYSVQIAAGGYYEVPAKYTGIIKGIWAAANGNARVTELV